MNTPIVVPTLLQKLRMCFDFLIHKTQPVIQLENGLLVDIENKRLVIPTDFHIHTEGTLRLSSDKHILINSGDGFDPILGTRWGIWLNSDVDNNGEPIGEGSPLLEDNHICDEADCSCKELKDGTK